MSNTKIPGQVIVVEGPDGAGKTTAARALAAAIGGVYVKLPDRSTATGQLIDSLLKGEVGLKGDSLKMRERAIQMIFAANNMEKAAELVALVQSGIPVVLDRSIDSAIVYYAIATGETLDESQRFILGLNVGMPRPDFVFVLELPAEEAQKRMTERGSQEERNDDVQTHKAVAAGFRARFDQKIGQPLKFGVAPWKGMFLDATQSSEVLVQTMTGVVKTLQNTRQQDAEAAAAGANGIYSPCAWRIGDPMHAGFVEDVAFPGNFQRDVGEEGDGCWVAIPRTLQFHDKLRYGLLTKDVVEAQALRSRGISGFFVYDAFLPPGYAFLDGTVDINFTVLLEKRPATSANAYAQMQKVVLGLSKNTMVMDKSVTRE